MARPRLNRTRHTVAIDETTLQTAQELFAETNAQLGGGLSWASFLGGLVRDGLLYRGRGKAPPKPGRGFDRPR